MAITVLSHGPNPDSSSINKATKFLVKKEFTGTDSRSVARLHFEPFCKPKLSHTDFELLYNNWIKDSLLFLTGNLSRNLEEQMLIFQVWEQQQLKRKSLVVVCANLMIHQVIAPKGKELYVVLVFKNFPQNRFHCSHNLLMQHA